MLFHSFHTNQEQRKSGSSAFVEIQFCKFPAGTKIVEIVSVDRIVNKQKDSLYVSDENRFFTEYSPIFQCGIYNNLKSGVVDVYGINYYSPEMLDSILQRLEAHKPTDYETLKNWLIKAKDFNGFYILGL